MKILKIGLTGGMGCGKSSAGNIFRDLKIPTIDADLLAREAIENDPQVRTQIAEIFGNCAYLPDGKANRPLIAASAFADKSKLAALEALVHPVVRKMWNARADEIERSAASDFPIIVVEIPLLFEKGLEKYFDICITVFCSEALRLERLLKRGMNPQDISARDAFQLPPIEKVRLASVALFNESDLIFLRKQISLTLFNLKTRWTKIQ